MWPDRKKLPFWHFDNVLWMELHCRRFLCKFLFLDKSFTSYSQLVQQIGKDNLKVANYYKIIVWRPTLRQKVPLKMYKWEHRIKYPSKISYEKIKKTVKVIITELSFTICTRHVINGNQQYLTNTFWSLLFNHKNSQ